MWNWLLGLIPDNYKASVVIKKVAYLVGKFAVGYATSTLVAKGNMTPAESIQVQMAVTTAVASGLEMLHDWAKLKWPNVSWF